MDPSLVCTVHSPRRRSCSAHRASASATQTTMPTLLQQILNKPSRQYASPSSASRRAEMRHYHSVKDEMVKVARSAIKANDHFQLQFQVSCRTPG